MSKPWMRTNIFSLQELFENGEVMEISLEFERRAKAFNALVAERDALAAENERLRKAGDAMHAAAVQDSTGLWLTKPFEDWARAKEGR